MRQAFDTVAISGTVVIGEGEMDEAPMLYIGEKVGAGGPEMDIAVDPLEGTNLVAKNLPNAITVVALAEKGNFLHAPDIYMDKIAIGPGYPEGVIDIDNNVKTNLMNLAKAKKVDVSDLTLSILERERHEEIIAKAREAGAHVKLQGRLLFENKEQIDRARKMNPLDPQRKLSLHDMANGNVLFSATGVTNGDILKGVRWKGNHVWTNSIVTRSVSKTIRFINACHDPRNKPQTTI